MVCRHCRPNPCSLCDGNGYHFWAGGVFQICDRCGGSGKKEGNPDKLVAHLLKRTKDLEKAYQRAVWEIEANREYIDELRSRPSRRPEPQVRSNITITDRDLLLHVLGLEGRPSHDEIKRAYKRRAAESHPDKHNGSSAAFIVVKSAFDRLMEMSDA